MTAVIHDLTVCLPNTTVSVPNMTLSVPNMTVFILNVTVFLPIQWKYSAKSGSARLHVCNIKKLTVLSISSRAWESRVQSPESRVEREEVSPYKHNLSGRETWSYLTKHRPCSTGLWLCLRSVTTWKCRLGQWYSQTFWLSDCQTVRLPYCQTVRLQDCQTVRLSECQTVRLSDCQTVRLSEFQTSRLSDSQYFRLSVCQTLVVCCEKSQLPLQ